MKKALLLLCLLAFTAVYSQSKEQRISNIRNQITALSVSNPGLTEEVKTEIQVNNISLANFLLAISEIHKVNLNVSPELSQPIKNNFTNVPVADVLVWLCKEYDLTIDFTGNILSIKPYLEPEEETQTHIIPIVYNPNANHISIDAKGDMLYDVFKRIMDETGKNLVFSPGLENKNLTAYIQNMPFDTAMDNIAFANNLYVEKTKEGFYLFENATPTASSSNGSQANQASQRPARRRNSNFYFKVLNEEHKTLEVDFVNTPIADIINDIGNALNIDIFTATPLDNAGVASFKTKSINFDELLNKIFESQFSSKHTSNNGNTSGSRNALQSNRANQGQTNASGNSKELFTYKKEGNTYFFGTEKQLSVRKVEVIALQYRSVELLSDPSGGNNRNQYGGYNNNNGGNFGNQFDNRTSNQGNRNTIGQQNQSSTRSTNGQSQRQDLLSIVPDEVKEGLDFKVDYELNSFYVTGTSAKIERFKSFIDQIDKLVPVVLIEVMIIEVSRSATTETGVSWGIGETPTTTQGGIFPETNLTLGATTINKIIGGFDDFGGFNLGKVVPNFFANIKAMETNGNFKILSTPKLTTLNGHRATFSNAQTSYYAVTQRNIYGTDNPQTSEITNYLPIEAELGLTIKPSVAGNGQVVLDISVVQSSFGSRIAVDAPPDVNSRTFTSIIRMQDQDIAILGGLEEQVKNNSGSGVPFLARIPLIKYLFSARKREAKKAKLSVLIKPTVIY